MLAYRNDGDVEIRAEAQRQPTRLLAGDEFLLRSGCNGGSREVEVVANSGWVMATMSNCRSDYDELDRRCCCRICGCIGGWMRSKGMLEVPGWIRLADFSLAWCWPSSIGTTNTRMDDNIIHYWAGVFAIMNSLVISAIQI